MARGVKLRVYTLRPTRGNYQPDHEKLVPLVRYVGSPLDPRAWFDLLAWTVRRGKPWTESHVMPCGTFTARFCNQFDISVLSPANAQNLESGEISCAPDCSNHLVPDIADSVVVVVNGRGIRPRGFRMSDKLQFVD